MDQVVVNVIGGEADGRAVLVPIYANRWFPLFIGLGGFNYVLDQTWGVEPAYVWWPPGADRPVSRIID